MEKLTRSTSESHIKTQKNYSNPNELLKCNERICRVRPDIHNQTQHTWDP